MKRSPLARKTPLRRTRKAKAFEIRKNDRTPSFRAGDILVLEEWDPSESEYTGRAVTVTVLDVWGSVQGVERGHVVMPIAATHPTPGAKP